MSDPKADADRGGLEQLEDEARQAKERFDRYRESVQDSNRGSRVELRRLQHAALYAEARLKRAQREA
jgi:multidrug resistance efflux pump